MTVFVINLLHTSLYLHIFTTTQNVQVQAFGWCYVMLFLRR